MSERVHLYQRACHDELTVWCQDPDESSAGWESTHDVAAVTCVPCLMAVERVGDQCRDRRHDLVAEHAARIMIGKADAK
jgi:hypothetical protein